MSEMGMIAIVFLSTIVGLIVSARIAIRATKQRIARWDSNSSVLFIVTMGGLGNRQVRMWQRRGGYSEGQAKTIIGYQLLAVLGPLIGFLGSAILVQVLH